MWWFKSKPVWLCKTKNQDLLDIQAMCLINRRRPRTPVAIPILDPLARTQIDQYLAHISPYIFLLLFSLLSKKNLVPWHRTWLSSKDSWFASFFSSHSSQQKSALLLSCSKIPAKSMMAVLLFQLLSQQESQEKHLILPQWCLHHYHLHTLY